MTTKTYHSWAISSKSVIGYGGKEKQYAHYCPKSDFLYIVRTLANLANKRGVVSKKDVSSKLDNVEIKKGKIFNSNKHRYKIPMVFQYLIDKKMIRFKGTINSGLIQRGKKPNGYTLTKNINEIIEKISKIM